MSIFHVNFDKIVRLGNGADFLDWKKIGVGLWSRNVRLSIWVGDSKAFDLSFLFALDFDCMWFGYLVEFPQKSCGMILVRIRILDADIVDIFFDDIIKKFEWLINGRNCRRDRLFGFNGLWFLRGFLNVHILFIVGFF